jgi:hypothetical protein
MMLLGTLEAHIKLQKTGYYHSWLSTARQTPPYNLLAQITVSYRLLVKKHASGMCLSSNLLRITPKGLYCLVNDYSSDNLNKMR